MADTTSTTISTQFLTSSDVAAALVGAGYSSVYQNSTPGMFAAKSLVISIIARLASGSTFMSGETLGLDGNQKNQLLVALMNALEAYSKGNKSSVMKAVISGVSVDLLAQELLKIIRMEDKVLIGSAN
jgi:hypothetical protein